MKKTKKEGNSPSVHWDQDAADPAEDLIFHVPLLQEVPDEDTKADIGMDECL